MSAFAVSWVNALDYLTAQFQTTKLPKFFKKPAPMASSSESGLIYYGRHLAQRIAKGKNRPIAVTELHYLGVCVLTYSCQSIFVNQPA